MSCLQIKTFYTVACSIYHHGFWAEKKIGWGAKSVPMNMYTFQQDCHRSLLQLLRDLNVRGLAKEICRICSNACEPVESAYCTCSYKNQSS